MRYPRLKTFATISPVPKFSDWLRREAAGNDELRELVESFATDADDDMRQRMERQVARYFLEEKNDDGEPIDPVARFHLKNGAILERINILANPSEVGMERAFGTMVNYVYDLARVEDNHEEYVRNGRVICSGAVKKALSR